MTSLVDFQIREYSELRGLIDPYDAKLQNPASYDVTLGDTILIEPSPSDLLHMFAPDRIINNRWVSVDISKKSVTLAPNEFILAHTAEFIRVPTDLEAVFCLKSSRGREGWEHALAGYIDPGYQGRITLELKNNSRYHSLKVEAGMRIGQLRFSWLDCVPNKSYADTGHYNNATTVEISKC
jgi:dCTP deaminase